MFKNEEGHDSKHTEEYQKTTSSSKGRDNDLARVHAQMAARRAAKANPTPTPPPPARNSTPAPSACEPSPAPSAHEPSPAPSVRKPSPAPTAPKQKQKPVVPIHESTPIFLAYQSAHPTSPARLVPVPAHAKSHVPSDLTESKDSEPVQIAIKCKAKNVSPEYTRVLIESNNLDLQAGGRSTKRKAPPA